MLLYNNELVIRLRVLLDSRNIIRFILKLDYLKLHYDLPLVTFRNICNFVVAEQLKTENFVISRRLIQLIQPWKGNLRFTIMSEKQSLVFTILLVHACLDNDDDSNCSCHKTILKGFSAHVMTQKP